MYIYQIYKNTNRGTLLVGTFKKHKDAEDYILERIKFDKEFAEEEGTEYKFYRCPDDVYVVSYTLKKENPEMWKSDVWRIVTDVL